MKAKPGKTTNTSKPQVETKSVVATKAAGPSTPSRTPPIKSAAQAAVKPVVTPASKPVPKASAESETPKAKMPSASNTKSSTSTKASGAKEAGPAAPVKARPVAENNVPAAKAPAADPASPASPPGVLTQRPGRPSSRLASLTVPSMAQSVASTAAKASYMQLAAAPMIVPPLPSAAKKDPKLANNWKTKPVEQLTDAELLAMPDSEYMNDKQMAAFRLKLTMLKRDILNSAGETTEHLREDTVVVPDPADRATIEEEHALELRTRDRERKLLKKIEQSIARIDAGDYGYCDETGEPIGVGRLLARPTATLSLEAQQRRELKQKMFGD